MSIDWQSLYSHLDNVRSSDERNGPGMLRLAIDRIIEVMVSLYRSYDDLVRHMQSSITTMSRECASLSVMLKSLETQLSAILRATNLPGGRGLYILHDLSISKRVVYDDIYGGYICQPVCEVYPLRKDPRSSVDLVIGYSTGRGHIDGDVRSLFEASDRSVTISVVSPSTVSVGPDDLNIPPNYRSGAVVRLDMHTALQIPFNEIIFESEHPVTLLEYGISHPSFLNRTNTFPDPTATGAWVNSVGARALFERDDIREGDALTLVPDTVNAFVRFGPANRVYPPGYWNVSAPRYTYMVLVNYVVLDAPVEATFNIIDGTGRRYISHTQVLYPSRENNLVSFSGAFPNSGPVGCTISVRRVGSRAGRLRILGIGFYEWLAHYRLNLPAGTRFVFPVSYSINAYTVSLTMALHAVESSEDGYRYHCTVKRFEPRVVVYSNGGELVSPSVTQKTHPITEATVFVEGDNLENSEVIVSADPSFTRTATIPASEAVNGARVQFVPVFGGRVTQLGGRQIPVPLQLASEFFTHGRKFELRNPPYCSAVMVRRMLDKFGRYEPNLDLTEVDFDVLMSAGTTVTGLVEVIETNPSDWKGSVLGEQRTTRLENGYMVLEGSLPASGGSISESVNKVVTTMGNLRGTPTIIKNQSGNYVTSMRDANWSGSYVRLAKVGPRGSAVFVDETVTNPFDEDALLIEALRAPDSLVWYINHFPVSKGWYRFRVKAMRPVVPGDSSSYRNSGLNFRLMALNLGINLGTVSLSSESNGGEIDKYFEVPEDLREPYLHIVVQWLASYEHRFAAITMPVLYPEYPPVFQQTSSNILSLGWNINPSPCFTDDVEVDVGLRQPIMLSEGHRIRFKKLSVQNAFSAGSQPRMELLLYKEGGGSVSCGQPLPEGFSGNANSGTWTDITWEVPSGFGNDVRVRGMVIRTRRLNPSTTSFQLNIDRLWENNNALVEVVRRRHIPPPDNVQVAMEWRGRSPIIVPKGEALTLSMKLKGFGQSVTFQMNGRVWSGDSVIIRDPEYTGENSESTVRTLTALLVGDGTPVETLRIVAHGSLSSTEKPFLLGVRTSMRKLSVFSTLVPIKLTVETPFGVFTPDVSGPLPAVGTRDVENERLALASDQQLEQYEQAVMDGQVSRQIKYDRPVYATRFSPIAIHPNGYPILTLDLYKRSDGRKVRTIPRNEYLLDAHRGLIQLIDDPGADYYIVATYRFRVTSESQLRMYESQVRGAMLTRNRTDYLSGLIPELRPVQFKADEVSGRPILEYYHQGNILVLAQDIPPSVDGRYTIRADYWYLPVNPTVKVVLRRPHEARTPIVRRVVLMV